LNQDAACVAVHASIRKKWTVRVAQTLPDLFGAMPALLKIAARKKHWNIAGFAATFPAIC